MLDTSDKYAYHQLKESLSKELAGKDYLFVESLSSIGVFFLKSLNPISNGTTNKVKEIIADHQVDIIHLYQSIKPIYLSYFVVVLNFSFWDIISLKKLFFLLNLARMTMKEKYARSFDVVDSILIFSFSSHEPMQESILSFYEKMLKDLQFDYLSLKTWSPFILPASPAGFFIWRLLYIFASNISFSPSKKYFVKQNR